MVPMPEALSMAPCIGASVCAMITMFSSVMPGSVPHTLFVVRPVRFSTVRFTCTIGDLLLFDHFADHSRIVHAQPEGHFVGRRRAAAVVHVIARKSQNSEHHGRAALARPLYCAAPSG